MPIIYPPCQTDRDMMTEAITSIKPSYLKEAMTCFAYYVKNIVKR